MPHDCNGTKLSDGDEVMLRATVRLTSTEETQCNAEYQIINQPGIGVDESYRPNFVGNTKFCEKVS